ncbi:MAG: cytochrome d ubiquinol oxidase subunit II [Phycisphaeraceae bacterium]|nr:cytochrome d ubiquinol oxidase subunit II [Phycisphaeraceae bacterium]
MDLHLLWFILLGVLLTGYAILDGFDLGVAMLHLAVGRNDHERRIILNSIGPLWDGNEVWLVTFGGALFAAFPIAYAVSFSAMYIPFMLLLLALIGRGVAIEFRSKQKSRFWRAYWDFSFFGASTLVAFLFGVSVGIAMQGIPIDSSREFVGSLRDLLGVYPVLTGLLTLSVFAMHGSIYLYLRTEGELQERVHRWVWRCFGLFLVTYIVTTIWTLTNVPSATTNFRAHPWLWVFVVLGVLAIANIPRAMFKARPRYAFVSSAATIATLVLLFGAALFPNLVTSSIDPSLHLNIYNSASSQKTLGIMAVCAAIGIPFVLSYTVIVLWIFRGKTRLEDHSY